MASVYLCPWLENKCGEGQGRTYAPFYLRGGQGNGCPHPMLPVPQCFQINNWSGASSPSSSVSWWEDYNSLRVACLLWEWEREVNFPLLTGTLHFYFTLDSTNFITCSRCVCQWQKRVDGIVLTHHASSRKLGPLFGTVREGTRRSTVWSQRVQSRGWVRNESCFHKLFGRNSSPFLQDHDLDSC